MGGLRGQFLSFRETKQEVTVIVIQHEEVFQAQLPCDTEALIAGIQDGPVLIQIVHGVRSVHGFLLTERDDVLLSEVPAVVIGHIVLVINDHVPLPRVSLPLKCFHGDHVIGSPMGQDEHGKVITHRPRPPP